MNSLFSLSDFINIFKDKEEDRLFLPTSNHLVKVVVIVSQTRDARIRRKQDINPQSPAKHKSSFFFLQSSPKKG